MKINNKLVSIVIPVYNRQELILETINSAAKQTYENIEIVVVDNKSTDGTWDIIKEAALTDQRIKVFQNSTNVGPVRNWKVCFDLAQGDYIKILWSDDLISDTFVADAIVKMDDNTAFVMSGVQTFDSETKDILRLFDFQQKNPYPVIDYLNDILMFNKYDFPSSPGCALFRTNELRKALMLDIPNTDNLDFKRFGAGNDLLLFLITAVKYKYIQFLPYPGSFYREHKQSLSISHASELSIYYEWAKSYFVNNYYLSIANEYKAKLFFKKVLARTFKQVYYASVGNLHTKDMIKVLLAKTRH